MTIKDFVAYVKQAWYNKPNTSTPVEASRLLHIENGIKGNSDAIEKIAAAVVSQIVNDPNKIASMAALFSVNQKISQQGKQITQLNSDFNGLKSSDFTLTKTVPSMYLRATTNAYSQIMKNANTSGEDYGTTITDFTNGVKTDLNIQQKNATINGQKIVKATDFGDGIINFDSIGFTQDTDGKFKLHFYKDGTWIGSIKGA